MVLNKVWRRGISWQFIHSSLEHLFDRENFPLCVCCVGFSNDISICLRTGNVSYHHQQHHHRHSRRRRHHYSPHITWVLGGGGGGSEGNFTLRFVDDAWIHVWRIHSYINYLTTIYIFLVFHALFCILDSSSSSSSFLFLLYRRLVVFSLTIFRFSLTYI